MTKSRFSRFPTTFPTPLLLVLRDVKRPPLGHGELDLESERCRDCRSMLAVQEVPFVCGLRATPPLVVVDVGVDGCKSKGKQVQTFVYCKLTFRLFYQ
jgi:hypothetical protein